MAQTTPDAIRLAQEYIELWNEQDYENVSNVVPDSFVHKGPGVPAGDVQGPDDVEEFIRQVTSAFPDFHIEVVDSLSSGDRAALELEFTMTHEGEFMGIPPTGREVETQSLSIIETEDGELREIREYADQQELFDQLGVTDE